MRKNKPDHSSLEEDLENEPQESIPSHEDDHDLTSKELHQKLHKAEEKAKEYWERIIRMQAENENAARRKERDIAHAHKFALEKFVNELIPIVDSLELSTTSVPEHMQEAASSMLDGVKLTLKMFYSAMEKFGIKQINPVMEPFDPEYQQAISTQVAPDQKPGTVVSVLQKGYTLNDRLIRPALVIVSKNEE